MRNIDASEWLVRPGPADRGDQEPPDATGTAGGSAFHAVREPATAGELRPPDQAMRKARRSAAVQMKKLKALLDQLRNLDPNDPGRWPLAVRAGTVILAVRARGIRRLLVLPGLEETKRPELLEERGPSETELMESLTLESQGAQGREPARPTSDQLADMEKSFGAMLRQLPNKTEVPNLLVDISQTGLAAGLEEKLFQPQGENQQGLLRRAADHHPPDRQLSPDGQLRERHRRAAAHRHAARHRDRAGRTGRSRRRRLDPAT